MAGLLKGGIFCILPSGVPGVPGELPASRVELSDGRFDRGVRKSTDVKMSNSSTGSSCDSVGET